MTRAASPPRAKVRIEEVARAANVSAATVSRALNNPGLVSDALRAKVDSAAQALGYVAHGAARALASTLRDSAPTEQAAWLAAGALADLGDALAIRRGAREGRLGRLPAHGMVLGASGAALLGAVAAVRAVAFGDQPNSS